MRKLLLFCLVLSLTACTTPPPADPGATAIEGDAQDVLQVRTIDGCQYLEYNYGESNYRVYSLTHKGNCNNPIHPVAQ